MQLLPRLRKLPAWRGARSTATPRLKPIAHVFACPAVDQDVRSEDIAFSPSGRRLAVVATDGIVYLFSIVADARPVELSSCTLLRSPSLASPHGVDFLDEDILVVANRRAGVTFYRLPASLNSHERITLDPIHTMTSDWFGAAEETRTLRGRRIVTGPGSIRAHGGVLHIACNHHNTVTAHPCTHEGERIVTGEGDLLVRDGIEIPDGVAISRDGRWMAVSDHDHRRVLVFGRDDRELRCELRDPQLLHPHGLCFDRSGSALFVADAGGRQVHVFSTTDAWSSDLEASGFRCKAVAAKAFRATRAATPARHRSLEGGIKGIDVDPSGVLVATTCRFQTVRFFEIEGAAE